MSLTADTDMGKLTELSARTYKDQAVFVLDAMWEKLGDSEADNIWDYCHGMVELDEEKGKDGSELNEILAHRFLEKRGETLTVMEMRAKLKEIDIDTNKFVSLAEYLIFRYELDWPKLVNTVPGNPEEMKKAQGLLDEAKEKMTEAVAVADSARAAEKENREALDVLEKEQKAYDDTTATLEKQTTEGGLVSKNRAKNELSQHKASDPLPLSRAKINQGASVRKAEKARKLVEPAEQEAIGAFSAAEAYMTEVANRSGSAKGGIWWLQRELAEAKKYLPQRKGGAPNRTAGAA